MYNVLCTIHITLLNNKSANPSRLVVHMKVLWPQSKWPRYTTLYNEQCTMHTCQVAGVMHRMGCYEISLGDTIGKWFCLVFWVTCGEKVVRSHLSPSYTTCQSLNNSWFAFLNLKFVLIFLDISPLSQKCCTFNVVLGLPLQYSLKCDQIVMVTKISRVVISHIFDKEMVRCYNQTNKHNLTHHLGWRGSSWGSSQRTSNFNP